MSRHKKSNGFGGTTNGFSFADIEDEPKFIELPDDYEDEEGELMVVINTIYASSNYSQYRV